MQISDEYINSMALQVFGEESTRSFGNIREQIMIDLNVSFDYASALLVGWSACLNW